VFAFSLLSSKGAYFGALDAEALASHAGLATEGLRTFRPLSWHRLTHVPICPNFGGYIGFIGIHPI
jgi:hypothetical protein